MLLTSKMSAQDISARASTLSELIEIALGKSPPVVGARYLFANAQTMIAVVIKCLTAAACRRLTVVRSSEAFYLFLLFSFSSVSFSLLSFVSCLTADVHGLGRAPLFHGGVPWTALCISCATERFEVQRLLHARCPQVPGACFRVSLQGLRHKPNVLPEHRCEVHRGLPPSRVSPS